MFSDTIKSRAIGQSSHSIETATGTVTRTYIDPDTKNVTHADVRINGQAYDAIELINESGVKLWLTANVIVNYRKGSKLDARITGVSNTTASGILASSQSLTDQVFSPQDIGVPGEPVLLYEDSLTVSDGATVISGRNIELSLIPGNTSGGFTNKRFRVSLSIPVYSSLPDPATSGLPDGSLIEVRAPGASTGSILSLDYTNSLWVDFSGGSSGGGINTVTSLPVADVTNYGSMYLLHTVGIKDSIWISMQAADGSYQMSNIATGRYHLTFDPLVDVAGCCLWLAADALPGLVNGDPVSSWTDASTSGLVFTHGSGTAPDYISSAYNGLPCVRNTSGNRILYTLSTPSGISPASGVTTSFVMKHGGVSGNNYVPICVGSNGYVGNNGYIPYIHYPDIIYQQSGVHTSTDPGAAPSSSGIHLYTFVDDTGLGGSGTVSIYIDGVYVGVWNSLGSMSNPASVTAIFGDTPTNPLAEIDLCEILAYSNPLSGTDRLKSDNYLLAKWGII